MSVRRFRPICQFLEDGTPVAVLAEFHEGYVSGDDYDALRAERDSLQKRVTECESVMLHYGMETEHSCMCQFNDDTGELAGECAYHEKIRAERDEAVALLREARTCLNVWNTDSDAVNHGFPFSACENTRTQRRIDAFLAKIKEGGE